MRPKTERRKALRLLSGLMRMLWREGAKPRLIEH
jgi:hypothetical protein